MKITDNKRIKFGIALDDCFWRKHRRKGSVADDVGVTRMTMSRYASGERMPTVETFMGICNALKMSDDEIIECLNAFREHEV